MTIPRLKRITIASKQALRGWLSQNARCGQSVMVVAHGKRDHPDHVSPQEIADALDEAGWRARRRYTLNVHLVGHVITNDAAQGEGVAR